MKATKDGILTMAMVDDSKSKLGNEVTKEQSARPEFFLFKKKGKKPPAQ